MIVRFPGLAAVCLCAAAWAQRSPLPPDRLAKVRGALDAIYRLEYAKAEQVSREMVRDWPEDPVGYVYLARVLWQQLLLEERALTLDRFSHPDFFSENPIFKAVMEPAAAQRFRTASEEAIRRARARAAQTPRDPAALYLLGAAFQNEASFQLSMNNAWLAAIRAGHRSYQAHRTLLGLDANYVDAHLVTGIYNYAAGSLPWKIKWIALLLGYHGSKERGRAELEAVGRGGIAADDALTVLVLLDAIDERWDLAIGNLEKLRVKYPENYLLHLDLAGLEIRRGQPAAAAKICRQLLAAIDARQPGFARLDRAVVFNHLAIALRAMKDFGQAEKWLRLALSGDSAPARSRSTTLLELGKTLDLAGRREEALQQYRLVRQMPDYANLRREASEYLGRPYRGK